MKTVLEVRDIEKTFSTVRAVDGLSFSVGEGEIFSLLGPNGAGKTTAVRMLVGITHPDSGSVEFSLNGSSGTAAAELIGYLPEERGLYRETPVLRTLVYFAVLRGMEKTLAQKAASEWLERFDLLERGQEKIDSLSKGNQQKVQFISAILHRPTFAILDEPFSGLDPINQEFFLDILRELRDGGMTVLLSAHQMNLVEKIADRVLLIDRGREVLSGTMEEIRSREADRKKLYVRAGGSVNPELIGTVDGVDRIEKADGGELVIWTSQHASLSRVIEEMSKRIEIASIHSEEFALHEIYIEAIGGRIEEAAAGEVEHEG